MRKIKNLSVIFSFMLCILLTGCGKSVQLPSGNDTSPDSFLENGRFREVIIDTSGITGDFIESAGCINDSGYSYLLTGYDLISGISNDYLICFDINGNITNNSIIDKPIKSNQGKLFFSSVNGSDSLPDNLPDDYECYVYYGQYSFNDDGTFSAVCNIFISYMYSDIDDISEYYRVNWDSKGKCISITNIEDDYSESYDQYESIIRDKDDNLYGLTTSGINMLDDNENYSSTFFNFINSGLFSYGFDSVHILNSDSFSGIYRNADNKPVLSCFVRDTSKSGQKALVIATSDLEYEFMKDVVAFNANNDKFDIAVIDYSDRSSEKDPLEGWDLLKADLLSGFRPDIILNTTGNDEYFTSILSAQNISVDLKSIISEDPDLSSIQFTDKAASLFYSGDSVYSIVPSYTYRTVVGDYERLSSLRWDINTFMDRAYSVDHDSMFFYMEYKDAFLKKLIEYNGSSYVDRINKSASFESDEFIAFLKYSSTLPEDYNEAANLYYCGLEPCDVLLNDQLCNGIGSMHYESTVTLRSEYIDLGFPVGTETGSGVISADNSFMIVSGRSYTNECWDFIKYYLTPEYQDHLTYGIPVTVSGFDYWSTVWYPDGRQFSGDSYFKDGTQYFVEPVIDTEAEKIINNINDCKRLEFIDYRVEQIVLEYAHQYFDGKITAEEAASLIDKDVEAYLAS